MCPGCGAVLAPVTDAVVAHPGASPSCTRLFEITLHGLREEAPTDGAAAATTRLADATYDAQHPVAGDPGRVPAALDRLADELGVPAPDRLAEPRPGWTTTIADVAADLDVIDLGALVEAWARAVLADRTGTGGAPGGRCGSQS